MRYMAIVGTLVVLLGCSATGEPAGQSLELLEHPAASMPGALGGDIVLEPGSGDLLSTWVAPVDGRQALLFSRSTDHGRTWSPPVAASSAGDSVYAQEESVPVLTVSEAGLAIAYGHVVPTVGTPWALADVRVTRSHDGGVTWLPGIAVNSDSTGPQAGHQFQGITAFGKRGLVAAWLDTRADPEQIAGSGVEHHGHGNTGHSGTAKLYWVQSDDFGATWGPNYQGGERMCDCCRVSLSSTADGQPLATWRQAFPENRRETVVAPLDTFPATPRPVHVDDWEYSGCPDAGPESAVDADGIIHVVWYTGKPGRAGIWYARSKTSSVSDGFGEPVAIDTTTGAPIARVAITVLQDQRVAVVYDQRPDFTSGLFHAVIERDGSVSRRTLREGQIRRPEIAGTRDGGVVFSWTEHTSGSTVVRYGALR